jgi:hypothetical protein
MRIKTLLVTAALAVTTIATATAQVYSVNAVGYVNLEIPPGFSMIANPLDAGAGNNTVANLLPGVPEGTALYKFDSGTGQYTINDFIFGEWSVPTMSMAPGEGAFIRNPGAEAFTVTFVGEVMQGTLTTPIPAGFSILSSKVPQSAQLDTVLGFPAAEGDFVYRFSNALNQYSIHSFIFGEWDVAPVPAVGESFFVNKAGAATWTRDFSVNQ